MMVRDPIAVLRARAQELREHLAGLSPTDPDYGAVYWEWRKARIVVKLLTKTTK